MIEHRAGSYNLRVGRSPMLVANEVEALLDDEGLDWLAVQEAGQYVRTLRRRLRGQYRVYASSGGASATAVLVRKGLRARGRRDHWLGGLGWERGQGRPGWHEPRRMESVRVGGRGGYRVGSVHLPPTPHAKSLPGRGRAHARAVEVLTRIVRRWSRRGGWVLAGDWNATPDSGYVAPVVGHGKALGRGIDWVLASGVQVSNVKHVKHGTSDHDPRVFTVRSSK